MELLVRLSIDGALKKSVSNYLVRRAITDSYCRVLDRGYRYITSGMKLGKCI